MTDTNAIVDGAAKVIAGILTGHIFASGLTAAVTGTADVVAMADDFTEHIPAVTVALSDWTSTLQPGSERLHASLLCTVWRPRNPLDESVQALYGDRDKISNAWIAHTKAYLVETTLQSAILAGGPGIVERRLGDPANPNLYLTLPFTVNVVCMRAVVPLPA